MGGYLPQIIHFDHPERTLYDTMLYEKNCTPRWPGTGWAHSCSKGEDVFKQVGNLSGGEQSRLRLCMLMDEKINLLILDEPTNHLDIASREWVEAAIEEFEGVLLFVSHDRYFIEKFAERIWLLEDGHIRDFPRWLRKYRSILEHEAAAKTWRWRRPPRSKREAEKRLQGPGKSACGSWNGTLMPRKRKLPPWKAPSRRRRLIIRS